VRGGKVTLVLDYDAHYCAYFRDHASEWRLEIPGASKVLQVIVDGTSEQVKFKDSVALVSVPKGLGKHTITVLQ
jgi:hypothetical protein